MMDFVSKLEKEVDQQVHDLELTETTVIKRVKVATEILSAAFERLKKFISDYEFKDENEEIYFFKEIKPRFYSKLIYGIKMYNLELNRPINNGSLKDYLLKELDAIQYYANDNSDFIKYYRSESTVRDQFMFLRKNKGVDFYIDTFTFERDPFFSTAADFKAAEFLANEMLQNYINAKIYLLESDSLGFLQVDHKVKITWTGKKNELIELLYALDSAGSFNFGKISLNKLAEYFGNVFNIELNNFSRDFTEMKTRNEQTPFLNKLKQFILDRMDDMNNNNRNRRSRSP